MTLSVQAYGTSQEAGDIVLVFTAEHGDARWRDTSMLASLTSALDDLADGVGTELVVGRESINLPADVTEIAVPMGPVLVTGAPTEWRKVLDRELEDLLPAEALPAVPEPPPWDANRLELSVLDTD